MLQGISPAFAGRRGDPDFFVLVVINYWGVIDELALSETVSTINMFSLEKITIFADKR